MSDLTKITVLQIVVLVLVTVFFIALLLGGSAWA